MAKPTEKQKQEFLEHLSSGEAFYKSAELVGCTEKDFYRLSASDEQFDAALSRAREKQQDALVEGMRKLADACDESNVNSTKLKIWAAQWIAAKRAPKKFGDKQQIESKVELSGSVRLIDRIVNGEQKS